MSGATGLDYTAVAAYLRTQGQGAAERKSIFAGIQACEQATLQVWDQQRAEQKDSHG